MTIWSLELPLLIASTKLRLSQWNSVDVLASRGPQTAQLNMMGTNSLAMMETSVHSTEQACWSY